MVSANSLANLEKGRITRYSDPKIVRSVSITMASWEELKAIAKELGLSTSEMLEQIGRKKLVVVYSDREDEK